MLLSLLILALLPRAPCARPVTTPYHSFAQVGLHSNSSDIPRRLVVTTSGHLLLAGTTTPFDRDAQSPLGTPLHPGLRADDVFIAHLPVSNSNATVVNDDTPPSVFRLGSSGEDTVHAMLVSDDGNKLNQRSLSVYLAGSCGASLLNNTHSGQIDAFIVKLTVPLPGSPTATNSAPVFSWQQPVTFGTSASESVNALAFDPANPDVIFAAGYTTGDLFKTANSTSKDRAVDADAFIVAVSASNGTVLSARQFRSQSSIPDYAADIYVSPEASGPVFVSVLSFKQYGNFKFGNFHLYKLSRDLKPLGDILLQSYSRETLVGFAGHPFLPNNLFVAGSSILDVHKGQDVFLKRVFSRFDSSNIGSSEVTIEDVSDGEYTRRYGSLDRRNDHAGAMVVHSLTGRLILGGYTQGLFVGGDGQNSSNSDDMAATDPNGSGSLVGNDNSLSIQPFITCIDPIDGSVASTVHLDAFVNSMLPSPSLTTLSQGDQQVELRSLTIAPDNPNALYYALSALNSTTGQFFTLVGIMEIPQSWRTRISIPPTPSPSQTPSVQRLNDNGFSVGIMAFCVGGAIAAIILIVIIVCVVRRLKANRDDGKGGALKLRPRSYDAAEEPVEQKDRIMPIDHVQSPTMELA